MTGWETSPERTAFWLANKSFALVNAAESVYWEHRDELWTSQFTLMELLVVAYREERDTERVVSNAASLLEIRGDVETVAEE